MKDNWFSDWEKVIRELPIQSMTIKKRINQLNADERELYEVLTNDLLMSPCNSDAKAKVLNLLLLQTVELGRQE